MVVVQAAEEEAAQQIAHQPTLVDKMQEQEDQVLVELVELVAVFQAIVLITVALGQLQMV